MYVRTTNALGEAAAPASVSFEMMLTDFQIAVAQATGKVLEKVDGILERGAAREWATNMNNHAASVVTSLKRPGANGKPFFINHPAKAAKLLDDAASWSRREAQEYDEARHQLLSLSEGLKQAGTLLGKAAGNVAAGAAEGAGEAATKALAAAIEKAKREGIASLVKLAVGLTILGGIAYAAVRR